MGTYIISRRIQFIIQFVNDNPYPSKQKILDFLSDKDFNLSGRTLDRDFDHIRADFGLEIAYSKQYNGYYIDADKSVKVASFFKFLELVSLAGIFSESLKDSRKILDYVSFDDSKSFKGIDHLKAILIAISSKRKLHFTHENFENKTFKPYVITPFLLKEYENRWFVIGVPEGLQDIRTFGVDRLSKVSLGTSATLTKKAFEKKLANFNYTVGVNFEDGQPKHIRILVNKLHLKYMRSLPLHASQVIHPQDENGTYPVDFYLIPNYEFMTQILKMGSDVEVLEPESFKNTVKAELEKTLKRYK
jgi:predicted DNA-binding transcriptional regulator YafY